VAGGDPPVFFLKEGQTMNEWKMNLLVTLNAGYLRPLTVMINSILLSDANVRLDVYILHKSLKTSDFSRVSSAINSQRLSLIPILIEDSALAKAPTSRRYPTEMYYRLFASRYLPAHLDRVLYLDPDLVVIRSLKELYAMQMDNHYFAACSHVLFRGIQKFNELRLNMEKDTPYINSGVLLMNLPLLREETNQEEVLQYIRRHKKVLMLPDQDVLSALYGSKTILMDSLIYNLSERFKNAYNLRLFPGDVRITTEWIREHAAIIHYCGKNKPWKKNYVGDLGVFYQEIVAQTPLW
jgi:lipopolysaccharide biosynthesis glycosyltransferase